MTRGAEVDRRRFAKTQESNNMKECSMAGDLLVQKETNYTSTNNNRGEERGLTPEARAGAVQSPRKHNRGRVGAVAGGSGRGGGGRGGRKGGGKTASVSRWRVSAYPPHTGKCPPLTRPWCESNAERRKRRLESVVLVRGSTATAARQRPWRTTSSLPVLVTSEQGKTWRRFGADTPQIRV